MLSAVESSFFTAYESFSSSKDYIAVAAHRKYGTLEKARSLDIDAIKVESINHKQFIS